GVSLVEHKTRSGMYSSEYGQIGQPLANFYFAGWTMPLSSIGIGVNWVRFAVSDIPRLPDLTDPRQYKSVDERYLEVLKSQGGETFTDAEDAFVFSFARNTRIDFSPGWNYSWVPLAFLLGVT